MCFEFSSKELQMELGSGFDVELPERRGFARKRVGTTIGADLVRPTNAAAECRRHITSTLSRDRDPERCGRLRRERRGR